MASTVLTESTQPIRWEYQNLYQTGGILQEIEDVESIYCLTDILDRQDIQYEVVRAHISTHYLSDQDSEQRNADTWDVYDLDVSDLHLYNDYPDTQHPLVSHIADYEERQERINSYQTGSIMVHIPAYEAVVYSYGTNLSFICPFKSLSWCEKLVNYIGSLTFYRKREAKPSQPTIQLVGQSTEGEFYDTRLVLPLNPITSKMLADCYTVISDVDRLDGQQLMDLMVTRIKQSRDNVEVPTYPNKGLYILQGTPGTGKSKFLSQLLVGLAASLKGREVFYFPPQSIELLGSPGFASWLFRKQGAVIIAEDAENVLTQKDGMRSAATSNILNLTDGLLGDALQLTFITTFNCHLHEIDDALLRPGRLQMAANFDRLSLPQAVQAHRTVLTEKYKTSEDAVPFLLVDTGDGISLAEIYSQYGNLTPVLNLEG